MKLKCSELATFFGQIDVKQIDNQQQPSTITANAFMNMLLKKMLKLKEKFWHRFNFKKQEQNVFAGDAFVNLNPEQDQSLLYELFKISSNFAEQFLQIARYEKKKLSKFGDNCSLINWAFYDELTWKFNKVENIMRKCHGSTSSFILYKYFNVNISWHEPDEDITAWKLDVPMLNEQRFVQSLLDYDDRRQNKMEMLKNGFKDFLSTFQKNEKSWAIVMPSAIEKMKREIDEQIKSLNEKFTPSINSVEQNRLFLLSMYRIALHFIQNLLANGLLNDEERKGFVYAIKNKMEEIFNKKGLKFEKMSSDELFGKKGESNNKRKERKEENLKKYFEGIEQYYYGIETGTKLKEWLEKFKNEQKNQHQLVSIEQIGSNESILAHFVAEKLADSIGDLLREGESLALLDWCHKNHRQISMTELAYIVEKLRELLFPDVPIVEWERERERTLRVDLNQLKNRLDKMPYDQILPKVVGEFFAKLFDGFNFIASSHVEISEIDRKLIFCFELSKFAFELLEKSLHEFNPYEDDKNIQQKLFHSKFYEELKEGFDFFRSDADLEFQKTTNVFVKLRSNWSYFQADFKYENVIASELRMKC
uniref:Uncharacterized protein n=1 Tax=Globodera rostochiensis TaxID=31243 RepID=A0A914HM51_GLORO